MTMIATASPPPRFDPATVPRRPSGVVNPQVDPMDPLDPMAPVDATLVSSDGVGSALSDRRPAGATPGAVAAVFLAVLVVLAAITTWLPHAESDRQAAPSAGQATESGGVATRLRLADHHLFSVLVATLMDDEAESPTWVDPRPLLACAPGSSFRINDRLLQPGAPVPAGVVTVDWFARDCRPYGLAGPRLDGHLRFVMAREDWGLSAARVPLDDVRLVLDGHWRRVGRADVASPVVGDRFDEPALQWAALPAGAARPFSPLGP